MKSTPPKSRLRLEQLEVESFVPVEKPEAAEIHGGKEHPTTWLTTLTTFGGITATVITVLAGCHKRPKVQKTKGCGSPSFADGQCPSNAGNCGP